MADLTITGRMHWLQIMTMETLRFLVNEGRDRQWGERVVFERPRVPAKINVASTFTCPESGYSLAIHDSGPGRFTASCWLIVSGYPHQVGADFVIEKADMRQGEIIPETYARPAAAAMAGMIDALLA